MITARPDGSDLLALGSVDVAVGSLFFQFALYVMVRLNRRGFTLGELGLVAQGATAIFLETFRLTVSKVIASCHCSSRSR